MPSPADPPSPSGGPVPLLSAPLASVPGGSTPLDGAGPLSWEQLEALAPAEADRVNGPTNAQASLRLFGQVGAVPRVTLYRDHHAWCPYCQKVWLWLEERRIPYRVRKVTMFCYGEKEDWYRRLVPSGMLPALELDGRVITESDRLLEALEAAFGPLGAGMGDRRVVPLRQLERMLFRAWCEWLCRPRAGGAEAAARAEFQRTALAMESALEARGGPFFLGDALTTADLVFVPYVERMNASLAYYKGFLLRWEHPAIHRWLSALEERSTYLGTQSDFHTHAHDLPPQMGGCYPSGDPAQRALAARIDAGPWPIGASVGEGADRGGTEPRPGEALLDPETTQKPPADAARVALARVLKHRAPILARNPLSPDLFDPALRCALTTLVADTAERGSDAGGNGLAWLPPPGSAPGLRYLRDRISVPRDMPLHAARQLRQALEATARRDPADPWAQSLPIPLGHRRDQDPLPFLAPLHSRAS
ncbi:MAG: glutathione S-transferase [Cyanobacteriota bacterium]|nr:glutathione S-transferase [Cyanobacteriota bacterium]